MAEKKDRRNNARVKIIDYMLNHPVTSKAELAKELNMSMPTVLTNVNELVEQGLIVEMENMNRLVEEKQKALG